MWKDPNDDYNISATYLLREEQAVLVLGANFYSKKSCIIVTKIYTLVSEKDSGVFFIRYLKRKYPLIYQGLICIVLLGDR